MYIFVSILRSKSSMSQAVSRSQPAPNEETDSPERSPSPTKSIHWTLSPFKNLHYDKQVSKARLSKLYIMIFIFFFFVLCRVEPGPKGHTPEASQSLAQHPTTGSRWSLEHDPKQLWHDCTLTVIPHHRLLLQRLFRSSKSIIKSWQMGLPARSSHLR